MRIFKQLLIISILTCSCASYAQEAAEPNRLEEINIKISSLQEEQKLVTSKLTDSQKQFSLLDKEIASLQSELKSIDQDLEAIKLDSTKLSDEIKDYSERADQLKTEGSKRLRAFYIIGGGQKLALNFVSQRKASFGKIINYLSAIRANEVYTLKEFNRLTAEKTKRITELDNKTKEISNLKLSRQEKITDLKKKVDQLDKAQESLKKQKSEKLRLISELRSESLRLETALSSLANSSEDQRKSSTITAKGDSKEVSSFSSLALSGLSDKFPSPINGKIVTRFGNEIVDDYGQKVRLKGVGYLAAANQEVLAVGDGKVSFIGPLGTYGNVVILDHGQRMYSLYSLLSSTTVALGASVSKGQSLGSVASVEPPKPYNLYFELRKEGKAIDPKSFLP